MGHLTILPSEQPLSQRIKSTTTTTDAAATTTTTTSPPSKHSREYGCNIFRLYVKSMCWASCQDNETPLSWQRRRYIDASDVLLRRHNLPTLRQISLYVVLIRSTHTHTHTRIIYEHTFSLLFCNCFALTWLFFLSLLCNVIWCDCKQTWQYLSVYWCLYDTRSIFPYHFNK